MTPLDALGFIAAALTSLSFIPQVVKIILTRDTSGISLYMYFLFVVGVACWLAWGYWEGQVPVMLANGLTLALSGTVLLLKIHALATGRDRMNGLPGVKKPGNPTRESAPRP